MEWAKRWDDPSILSHGEKNVCVNAARVLLQVIAENERLREIEQRYIQLATPEIHDFTVAMEREAAHQRDLWKNDHDAGKGALDWLWLIGFLATKAAQADRYGDREKYLHHIITAAAACCNWHANATGANTMMRAGSHVTDLPTQPEPNRD